MYRFSRERAGHLARAIVAELDRESGVHLLKDREVVSQSMLHALVDAGKRDEERDVAVRLRIAEMEDVPPEGSREWDALFRRMLDEEYDRQGFELP